MSTDCLRFPSRDWKFPKGPCVIACGSVFYLDGGAGLGEGKWMASDYQLSVASGHPGWESAVTDVAQWSPLPLTLCTSVRSSAAGRRHRSAPGCAGLQAGGQSCTSSPQQSAPAAHHCSSARDCTEWLGDHRMSSEPPSLSGQRQQGQQSALWSGSDRSWLCDLSYIKNL